MTFYLIAANIDISHNIHQCYLTFFYCEYFNNENTFTIVLLHRYRAIILSVWYDIQFHLFCVLNGKFQMISQYLNSIQ